MFLGTKYCPWCGAEPARESRTERPAGPCPRCLIPLLPAKVGKSHLDECRQCGGLWVDTASFQQICEDREDQEQVLGIAAPAPEQPLGASASRAYVPCPVCGKLMNRMNFASCSGVIIDWCKEHGTWFDKDELRRIVEFIRGGGMKKSRSREKEKLKDEARRAQSNQLAFAVPLAFGPDEEDSLIEFFTAAWRSLKKM